jgi:hypothetical protein
MTPSDVAERLASAALAGLSGAGIATPVEGYLVAPFLLAADLAVLVKQRDEARREVELLKAERDCDSCIPAALREAHAEIERLRAGQHLAEMNVAALEALRERCATALDGHDGHYGLSGSAARRIVRAVPLEVA